MSKPNAIPRSSIITIVLPELSPQEALVVLDILEDLHSKLWHVYGDTLVELLRRRSEAPTAADLDPDQDDLPF